MSDGHRSGRSTGRVWCKSIIIIIIIIILPTSTKPQAGKLGYYNYDLFFIPPGSMDPRG